MKIKLDENLGTLGQRTLQAAGHDVVTVANERLAQGKDEELLRICRREGRALVTLDLDFANPLHYPPRNYAGIAVLRLPGKPSFANLDALVRTLAGGLEREQLPGKLWVVEVGRFRVFEDETA